MFYDFGNFALTFYGNAANNGFRQGILSAYHKQMNRVEMAGYVTIHLLDDTGVSFPQVLEYDARGKSAAEARLGQFARVTNVYVLAGTNPPDFASEANNAHGGIEEYFGQAVYSIFWHFNLLTGELTVPKGQPKKIFDIHTMLKKTHVQVKTAALSDDVPVPTNFQEITRRANAKHHIKPKYPHPIASYGLIGINAAIMVLMYMAGYSLASTPAAMATNIDVALQFGAMRADLVLQYGHWHRLFAATFVHFGWMHLAANVTGILIFGSRLERYLGRRLFFTVYILAGLLGSVFSLINLNLSSPHVVSAGASGAVYGLIGAMFIYTRITKRQIEFINWYVMTIYIGIGMAMGFATPGIDNFAHLGGLVGGIIIGGVYALLEKRKPLEKKSTDY